MSGLVYQKIKEMTGIVEETVSRLDPSQQKAELLALYERRTAIEERITESLAFLETTPVGMDAPLVDGEGFPRNDCDLYAVRTARNAVRCGRNDLNDIEEQLYEKLAMLHDDTKEEAELQMSADEEKRRKGKAEAEMQQKRMVELQRMNKMAAILTIASVQVGSPAYDGGLRAGLQVLQYGNINAANVQEKGLQAIADTTRLHEGEMLSVWVKNPSELDADAKELFIVPQKWSGGGLLGCAMDPI